MLPPITAAEILNDRVLPFFEEYGIVLCRVLTDRGTDMEARDMRPGRSGAGSTKADRPPRSQATNTFFSSDRSPNEHPRGLSHADAASTIQVR
jgi:hypothetical protein